jgi:hypothetical protein
MNSQTSRKVVVASAMAAVVGIGVVTFALRSHPVASVAQTPHPPAPVAQIPAADPPAVAQIPDDLAVVAQNPAAPALFSHDDSVGTKTADTTTPSAVESKLAPKRHLAKASTSAVATNVDRVKSADELTTAPATSNSPADDQKAGTSTEFAASDTETTTVPR